MQKWSNWFGGLLVLAYAVWLLATVGTLGYARDEGFYFFAAERYRGWFETLFSSPFRAFGNAVIDYHWSVNREHPPLIKTLMVLSHYLLVDALGIVKSSGTAYRAVGVASSAITLWVVFVWGRKVGTLRVGVFGMLALALMPRYFYHSHLACFDVPVACLWVATAFAYCRATTTNRRGWLVAAALCFGALLSTKHNAWLLPPVIVAHGAVLWVLGYRRYAAAAACTLLVMSLVGPLVLYASWPWIWHDTWSRLSAYVAFHTGHEYYNMEFLGRTYFEPPMPRLYAWVMTLATVPLTTLALFAIGVVACTSVWWGATRGGKGLLAASSGSALLKRWVVRFARVRCAVVGRASTTSEAELVATTTLWFIALLVSYGPWWSSNTPIFGGTKHWITAYPFMALFAGFGAELVLRCMERLLTNKRAQTAGVAASALTLALPSLVMTIGSHPFGLSFYTPLVGGAPGAASLGLNRTFWGYTTGSLVGTIDQHAPPGAVLYLHDTARASFDMLQRDGRIRSDIRGTLDIAESDLALYHHEPHMSRVEYQIWMNYGTVSPSAVATYQGVPIAWLYERPSSPKVESRSTKQ